MGYLPRIQRAHTVIADRKICLDIINEHFSLIVDFLLQRREDPSVDILVEVWLTGVVTNLVLSIPKYFTDDFHVIGSIIT